MTTARRRVVGSCIVLALSFASFAALAADVPAACLPTTIDGFHTLPQSDGQRAASHEYRNTTHAGYKGDRYNFTATVYVYDRAPGHAEEAELADATNAILQAYPDVGTGPSGRGKLPIAGGDAPALGGYFFWTMDGVDVGSFLWIVPREHHYLKIRASYIRPESDAELVPAMRYAQASVQAVARAVCLPD